MRKECTLGDCLVVLVEVDHKLLDIPDDALELSILPPDFLGYQLLLMDDHEQPLYLPQQQLIINIDLPIQFLLLLLLLVSLLLKLLEFLLELLGLFIRVDAIGLLLTDEMVELVHVFRLPEDLDTGFFLR